MISVNGHYFIGDEFKKLVADVEGMYGEISIPQLKKSIDIIEDFLRVYPRVFAVRVDLHFPQVVSTDAPDMPIYFARIDSKAITRFFASLESQLRAEHYRKEKKGSLSSVWLYLGEGTGCQWLPSLPRGLTF